MYPFSSHNVFSESNIAGISLVYIGATYRTNGEFWRLVGSGEEATYFRWMSGQPNNPVNEGCLVWSVDGWHDIQCNPQKEFVCQWITPCENELNGVCYKLIEQQRDWGTAEQYCIDRYDGHLAAIASESINDHVVSIAQQYNIPENRVWLGGTDAEVEGIWRWSTDSSVMIYGNWHSMHPNDHLLPHLEEDCLILSLFTLDWGDRECSVLFFFVCQWDA